MAIHNQVYLYGMIERAPRISFDDEGNIENARGMLTIVKGTRKTGEKLSAKRQHNYMTSVPYYSEDIDVCKIINTFKEGDLVLFKGNLLSKNVKKARNCPMCGKQHIKEGATFLYFGPIHASVEHTGLSLEQATTKLKEYAEVSNVATFVGTVCKEPVELTENKRKDRCIKFPIAIDRKYFVATEPDIKTDYLWVHCYGKKNLDAAERVHPGTLIFIDGTIRLRTNANEIEIPCDNPTCPGVIKWTDTTIDIVPLSLELLNNWTTDEELEKKASDRVAEIENAIFDEDV